ncbi:unnamed protein product [Trichogramma brassicae]|uniref:MADF domain-containing protein n=1 Tax=Trichogramma brassicae TaxID=86971 RepID=A0A6H5IBK9_9HYME|nr:unnamed protein product [Trichogramma brassicae]
MFVKHLSNIIKTSIKQSRHHDIAIEKIATYQRVRQLLRARRTLHALSKCTQKKELTNGSDRKICSAFRWCGQIFRNFPFSPMSFVIYRSRAAEQRVKCMIFIFFRYREKAKYRMILYIMFNKNLINIWKSISNYCLKNTLISFDTYNKLYIILHFEEISSLQFNMNRLENVTWVERAVARLVHDRPFFYNQHAKGYGHIPTKEAAWKEIREELLLQQVEGDVLHNFFGPLSYCWYNLFNHHFFQENSETVLEQFLTQNKENLKYWQIIKINLAIFHAVCVSLKRLFRAKSTISALKKHTNKKHDQDKSSNCETWRNSFDSQEDLIAHKNKFDGHVDNHISSLVDDLCAKNQPMYTLLCSHPLLRILADKIKTIAGSGNIVAQELAAAAAIHTAYTSSSREKFYRSFRVDVDHI